MRAICLLSFLTLNSIAFSQSFYLFAGTYTNNGSKGIYVYEFNSTTGKSKLLSNTEGLVNPSYLAISHNRKYLYAVTETSLANAGSVSAFIIDTTLGKLTFINKQFSGGDNPCYVSVHANDKWVVTGNYSGGNLSVFAVRDDGGLEPLSQCIQHSGSGVNKSRQDKPHVHSTVFSPDYKYLFVPDLGIDKVMIYNFNAKSSKPVTPAKQSFVKSIDGGGPRHFIFHPGKKYAYLIEELSGTVAVFGYRNGRLSLLQRIAAHPTDYTGAPGSADIHLSPDGKFLYASNRGEENNIAIFSVNAKSGVLTVAGYASTLGKTPRNFMIDPTGKYLLVANQATNNIVIFTRNSTTGLLTPTGEQITVPTPVCLKMIPK